MITSPFTGGKVLLKQEEDTLIYRGEEFSYIRYFYVCEDTGTEFTDRSLDEKSLGQVYEQYRRKYGIPSAEELKACRKKYGLSALNMAKLLGLGDNQYRLYENGDMPSLSVGRMLSLLSIDGVMEHYAETAAGLFDEDEYAKIRDAVTGSREEEDMAFPILRAQTYSQFAMAELYPSERKAIPLRVKQPRWADYDGWTNTEIRSLVS